MRSDIRRRRGFTVIELMVAVMITGIVSVAVVQMLQVGQRSSERNRILVEMQQNARVGLESLSGDLRHISYGKDPSLPSIDFAGPDSVSFLADIVPGNDTAERISFYLSPDGDPDTPNPNDTVLMRTVRDTSGAVIIEAPQAYGIAPNGLSFRWFNGRGVELANPVPSPELVGEVLVSLTAAGAREINGGFPTYTLSSTIYPRNLPLSPARSRPSAPGCTALTYPNCESATITWTTPTTNTDGTELPLTDISHFNIYTGPALDQQDLYTRLARTINEWTLNGLEPGQTHYISVTCVSNSGVESHKCTQIADLISPFTPDAPASLFSGSYLGSGVHLTWSPVTSFTTGDPITTPVSYKIYRDASSGFTPDDDQNLLAMVSLTTEYVDSSMVGCSTFYYRVCAQACGNTGNASPEAEGTLPAPPSCVEGITVAPTQNPQQFLVTWDPPATRMDGSSLDPGDIAGYQILADTLPVPTTVVLEVQNVSSAFLSGLEDCVNYYLNVRCVDACSNPGDVCLQNEVTFFSSSPCDYDPPEPPVALELDALDDRIVLKWPANQVDCDLLGYNIYYGLHAGGPYDGYGAAEGPSPVFVTVDQVTMGDICRFELTSLSECQDYFAVVTAVDRCDPPNESQRSPERGGLTACTPCGIHSTCTAWAVDGEAKNQLHLEVFTNNAGGETLTKLTPYFGGDNLVRAIGFGRPLRPIWTADGTYGEDGNIGPQPSGSTLDIEDITVPAWTSPKDGEPVLVLFNNDIRDLQVGLTFRGYSGQCTVEGAGPSAARVDNFDDGDYTGWTPLTGYWAAQNGEVWQSLNAGFYLLKESYLSLSDLTFEAKVKVQGGEYHSAYLAFRMRDAGNYYIFGIRGVTNRVRLARISGGSWDGEIASVEREILDDVWYTLRVVAEGGHIQCWLNCEKVVDVYDETYSSGGVGLTTRYAAGAFDDVKIFSAPILP